MTKGVSRQPEGVTPAYSQAGSEKRRKRRTRDTSSFYGAQARFRTDNVDPIENAYASCLKAIDCFSSNMSETAALHRPSLSPSHVASTKSLSVNCINAVLANVRANMYVRTKIRAADVNLKERKKLGREKTPMCVRVWARLQ